MVDYEIDWVYQARRRCTNVMLHLASNNKKFYWWKWIMTQIENLVAVEQWEKEKLLSATPVTAMENQMARKRLTFADIDAKERKSYLWIGMFVVCLSKGTFLNVSNSWGLFCYASRCFSLLFIFFFCLSEFTSITYRLVFVYGNLFKST